MKPHDRNIEEVLKRSLPSASSEQIESARLEVYEHARSAVVEDCEEHTVPARWRRFAMIPAAAAVVVAAFIGLLWRQDALAIGESEDGSRYRIGETVRTTKEVTINLVDGTRVEVKSESEFSFEGAKSAVEINLSHGSVIVNSETQPVVQTRDVRVPIAGTVLVNAESEGSRVAVIQGEARVRQGAIEKTLRPGEQMATNPSMELSPVIQELAWSPRAGAHMALLHQSVVAPANPSPGRETTIPKWEAVSVRPCENRASGARGGGGEGQANQFDPERMVLRCQNLWTLVMTAYGQFARLGSYEAHTLPIVGGPSWMVSELYTIEAKAEKPVDRDVMRGPMLQAILEDRFKLKLRRESRDIPLLVLTVAKGGPKMQPHQEGSCVVLEPAGPSALPPGKVFCGASIYVGGVTGFMNVPGPGPRPSSPPRHQTVDVKGLTVEEFIRGLMYLVIASTNTPVIDKTGITGKFDFRLEYAFWPQEIKQFVQSTGRLESDFDTSPTVYEALEAQLGLKLENTKGPWPHLVIDYLERPSPN